MEYSDRYLALRGLAPQRIPHNEVWACPDAETYLTGIDYWEHPQQSRQRLAELYPQLELPIPETDTPIPRPPLAEGQTSFTDEKGRHYVRWGEGLTSSWDWGEDFHSAEDVFAFSPLEHADLTGSPISESRDYASEERVWEVFRPRYPAEWGERAPEGSTASVGFYNTMFMWPLLTFGWALFMECCLDPRFERIMDEFAEINRRVFGAFARLPVNFVFCHDDIVNARGPVCSPAWMHKYIFPRYEEFWGRLRAAGKQVVFVVDGRIDAYAPDVMACGATGFWTEPYGDFRGLARRYENIVLMGEGDVRVLLRNHPAEIEAMVRKMVETAQMTGGYLMSIGNNIPWNTPGEAIKRYLDLAAELAHR